MEHLPLPVDVLDLQPEGLADAQATGGEQHGERPVALRHRRDERSDLALVQDVALGLLGAGPLDRRDARVPSHDLVLHGGFEDRPDERVGPVQGARREGQRPRGHPRLHVHRLDRRQSHAPKIGSPQVLAQHAAVALRGCRAMGPRGDPDLCKLVDRGPIRGGHVSALADR